MNDIPAAPLRVTAIIFEGFELLDLYGPLEMFGLLDAHAQITVAGAQRGPARSSAGPSGHADVLFAELNAPDVLLLPGGIGIRRELKNPAFLAELKRLATAARWVGTICTGSALLAATGLLDGCKATTNKRAFNLVRQIRPAVQWEPAARWVEDGKYFTASGVSAGMDMALALIARAFDRDTSLQIAQRAEYEWHENRAWDPFAKLAGL